MTLVIATTASSQAILTTITKGQHLAQPIAVQFASSDTGGTHRVITFPDAYITGFRPQVLQADGTHKAVVTFVYNPGTGGSPITITRPAQGAGKVPAGSLDQIGTVTYTPPSPGTPYTVPLYDEQ